MIHFKFLLITLQQLLHLFLQVVFRSEVMILSPSSAETGSIVSAQVSVIGKELHYKGVPAMYGSSGVLLTIHTKNPCSDQAPNVVVTGSVEIICLEADKNLITLT